MLCPALHMFNNYATAVFAPVKTMIVTKNKLAAPPAICPVRKKLQPISPVNDLLERNIRNPARGARQLCQDTPVFSQSIVDVSDQVIPLCMQAVVIAIPAIFITKLFIGSSFY